MQEERIDKVEYFEQCPVCGAKIKIIITKSGIYFYSYVEEGCKHIASNEPIDNSKYRLLSNLIKSLYEDVDLKFKQEKTNQTLRKMKELGIDISNYL